MKEDPDSETIHHTADKRRLQATREAVEAPLILTGTGEHRLRRAAGWASLIAIVGFVVSAIFIISGMFAMIEMYSLGSSYGFLGEPAPGTTMLMSFLSAAIIIATSTILSAFARNARRSIRSRDKGYLERSLGSLMAYFVFLGILLIIAFVFGFLMGLGMQGF